MIVELCNKMTKMQADVDQMKESAKRSEIITATPLIPTRKRRLNEIVSENLCEIATPSPKLQKRSDLMQFSVDDISKRKVTPAH